MNGTRAWSAPGKLFVSGEYAVLWGGVARLLAVEPRTRVAARRRDDGQIEVLLEGRKLAGASTPAGVAWSEPPGPEFHFVARTVDLTLRAGWRASPGFSLAFSPSPTFEGRKLGLGSSARAAVLAAEASRWALDATLDTLKLALVAHAEAQGGRGSGGDVAASFAGGSIAFRRFESTSQLASSASGGLGAALSLAPPVELTRLPGPRLEPLYVYSGVGAATPALIARAEHLLDHTRRAAFVLSSDSLSAALQEALVSRDVQAAREACDGLQDLLDSLAGSATPAVERILQLARSGGCAAKQSGAGGGDGCLVFAPDPEVATSFLATVTARGLYARRVAISPGLTVEPHPEPELVSWL
jgi:phosphomevalonate kinase